MKKYLLFLIIFLFYGCGSSSQPTPIKTSYQPGGIKINYESSNRLNFFENEAHSIIVFIYQLSDKNMFEALCNDQSGVYELLKGKIFDKSVLNVTKKIIFPAQKGSIIEDRLQNTKYIGIVAGYFNSPKCILIPLKIKNAYFTSVKFWKPTKYIENLNTNIVFLEDNIQIKGKK
ncbi:type VI secretion system lipoprotein TssJ [Nautilia lithotrophica]